MSTTNQNLTLRMNTILVKLGLYIELLIFFVVIV